MPGPQPVPTALKILKGVRPARINQKEPRPKSHSGAMPPGWGSHMSEGAKRFWQRYAPMLSQLGILTEADLPALRVAAELYSKWVRLTSRINRARIKLEDELVYLRALDKLETQLLRYLQHFGMTATSRGKIAVGGHEDEEEEDLD